MTITELIKKLEQLKAQEGDLKVYTYDYYTEAEGWDFEEEDLFIPASPSIREKGDTEEKVIVL